MSSIDKFNKLNKTEFLSIFGNVFEKTEWIAEKCYNSKPYDDLDELFAKMMEIFENSKQREHLKILNAHPYLAIEKKLTKDSANEQNNANLDQCSDKEFEEFQKLNKEYKKKFGFPFIVAVKGKNKYEILENFKKRIKNEKNIEFEEAKNQVKKIASFRLGEIKKNN